MSRNKTEAFLVGPQSGFTAKRALNAFNCAIAEFGDDFSRAHQAILQKGFERLPKYGPASHGGSLAMDSDGYLLPRDLESARVELLEDKYPIPDSFLLFPALQGIEAWAETYRTEHIEARFASTVVRPGSEIPLVGMGTRTTINTFHLFASGWETPTRNSFSNPVSIAQQYKTKGNFARMSVMRHIEKINWQGDEDLGLYGVANYPYLLKMETEVPYNSESTSNEIYEDFLKAWNYVSKNSQGAFGPPDTVAIASGIYDHVTQKLGGQSTDTTLGTLLQSAAPKLKMVRTHSLDGIGPGGTSGMFFYRSGDINSVERLSITDFNIFPEEIHQLMASYFGIGKAGGLSIKEPESCVLLWAQGPE